MIVGSSLLSALQMGGSPIIKVVKHGDAYDLTLVSPNRSRISFAYLDWWTKIPMDLCSTSNLIKYFNAPVRTGFSEKHVCGLKLAFMLCLCWFDAMLFDL